MTIRNIAMKGKSSVSSGFLDQMRLVSPAGLRLEQKLTDQTEERLSKRYDL